MRAEDQSNGTESLDLQTYLERYATRFPAVRPVVTGQNFRPRNSGACYSSRSAASVIFFQSDSAIFPLTENVRGCDCGPGSTEPSGTLRTAVASK